MFYAYNSDEFGDILKTLREDLRLSQTAVSRFTKISVDALRRIENGYVTPKIETLVRLSLIYKINLIRIYCEVSKVPDLVSLYSKVSLCIKNSDIDGLKALKNAVDLLKSDMYANGIILIEDYDQFQLFCAASILFLQNKSMIKAKNKAVEAIRVTHPDFSIKKLNAFKYNDFEVRILHLLAIIENRSKNHLTTIQLIEFLLGTNSVKFKDEETIRNMCLLYFTLSYAYNELGDYLNCLKIADQGIAFSVHNNRYKELHLLYYRKGIAEFMLKQDQYLQALQKSITLLEIANNHELIAIYKKVTLEQYNIVL